MFANINFLFEEYVRRLKVDFSLVPVHIHQIPRERVPARILRLKPGIHYAVRTCADEEGLRAYLRQNLDTCVNELHRPYAGLVRGEVTIPSIEADFDAEERDALYNRGINPMIATRGSVYVWGNMFVSHQGEHDKIVCHNMYTRQPVINPNLHYWQKISH